MFVGSPIPANSQQPPSQVAPDLDQERSPQRGPPEDQLPPEAVEALDHVEGRNIPPYEMRLPDGETVCQFFKRIEPEVVHSGCEKQP